MKDYNTRISILVGLTNTYNVFALDAAKADDINIEVITSGGKYVEDDASTVMHAGTSNWKEFDGIKDISSTDWSLDYGQVLSAKLKNYLNEYKDSLTGTGTDIYDSNEAYQNYRNLFNIIFKSDVSLTSLTGQYINYKKEPVLLEGLYSILGLTYGTTKGDMARHYIYLNADILHFSKYYPIYKISDMLVPVLQPVLYTKEDLANLNLFINSQGILCVNTLDTWTFWGDNWGDSDHGRSTRYDAQSDGSFRIRYIENAGNLDYNDEEEWDYSQYRQGSANTHHLIDNGEVGEERFNNYYPRGFMIRGFQNQAVGWHINDNNGVYDGNKRNARIISSWTSTFNSNNYTYDLALHGNTGDNSTMPLCALAYRGDSEDNVHTLNCWFTLKATGNNAGEDNSSRRIYQETAMKSTVNKPKYVGMWIAAVLCNMYHYVEDSGSKIPIVTDIIYLSDHYTTYTKDMIYYASTEMSNELLVFNGYNFRQYIAMVKLAAGVSSVNNTSSDKNITANIRACIKNAPIQYRIKYEQPDMDALNGGDGMFLLKTIDNPKPITLHGNSKLQPNRLYLVNIKNDKYEVDYLRRDFEIRYIKSLSLSEGEGIISGVYDDTMESDSYNLIDEVWGISENLYLNRNTYKIPVLDHYSIVSYEDSRDVTFKDFEKNEVLVPFAKFVK